MRAQLIRSAITATDLGIVLPHEHLHADLRRFLGGRPADSRALAAVPIEDLERAPMEFLQNLDLLDEGDVVPEVAAYARAGGKTLVELTPIDLARDPLSLDRISVASGLQVIMGTGYYVRASHPAIISEMSIEDIARTFVREIEEGVDGLRAGVIGEIGTSDPLDPQEASVVRAAALAQLATGCPINLHFAGGCREVFHVLEILREVGITDFSRVVISHMDVVIDLEQQREVAQLGAIVEYDTFGHENYPDSRGNRMPRDEERLAGLAQLVEWGLEANVLISQDVCLRTLWHSYGGRGYDNLLTRIPPMMRTFGIDPQTQAQLMIANPSRVFAFLPEEGDARSVDNAGTTRTDGVETQNSRFMG